MNKKYRLVLFFPFILVGWKLLIISSLDPSQVTSVVVSNDKNYIAFGYNESGGGGAGWCAHGINIRRISNENEISKLFSNEKKVFNSHNCLEVPFKWGDGDMNLLEIFFCGEGYILKEDKFREITIKYTCRTELQSRFERRETNQEN